MFHYPSPIEDLIATISKLQGIGKKTAERLVFDLYNWSPENINNFSQQLIDLQTKISQCKVCHNFTERPLCHICENKKRDESILCIIESPNQIKPIEQSGSFTGYYHILGGKFSPLEGVGPEQLNINSLLERIKDNHIKEVIIAISSDIEGQATSSYLSNLLKNKDISITRLALGIPVGVDLTYADSSTLAIAIKQRQSL